MKLGHLQRRLKQAQRRQALLRAKIHQQEVLLKISKRKFDDVSFLIEEYSNLINNNKGRE